MKRKLEDFAEFIGAVCGVICMISLVVISAIFPSVPMTERYKNSNAKVSVESNSIKYKYIDWNSEIYDNAYKVEMYYNDHISEFECIFTEKSPCQDDTVIIYEDDNGEIGNIIGYFTLIDGKIDNETIYNKEGIYLGEYDSYMNQKTVWIQFMKCKG